MTVNHSMAITQKGRPKAHEVQARVDKWLDVAAEVFLEFGFERTKVSEIVRRAGASKSSIYSRYPTKHALFEAVISRKIALMDAQMTESLSSSQSVPVLLRRFGHSLFETLFSPDLRALFKTVIAQSSVFPELAETFWQAGPESAIRSLADVLHNHKDFKGDDPVQAADVFISMCIGTVLLKAQLMSDLTLPALEVSSRLDNAIHLFESVYLREPDPLNPGDRADPI